MAIVRLPLAALVADGLALPPTAILLGAMLAGLLTSCVGGRHEPDDLALMLAADERIEHFGAFGSPFRVIVTRGPRNALAGDFAFDFTHNPTIALSVTPTLQILNVGPTTYMRDGPRKQWTAYAPPKPDLFVWAAGSLIIPLMHHESLRQHAERIEVARSENGSAGYATLTVRREELQAWRFPGDVLTVRCRYEPRTYRVRSCAYGTTSARFVYEDPSERAYLASQVRAAEQKR